MSFCELNYMRKVNSGAHFLFTVSARWTLGTVWWSRLRGGSWARMHWTHEPRCFRAPGCSFLIMWWEVRMMMSVRKHSRMLASAAHNCLKDICIASTWLFSTVIRGVSWDSLSQSVRFLASSRVPSLCLTTPYDRHYGNASQSVETFSNRLKNKNNRTNSTEKKDTWN